MQEYDVALKMLLRGTAKLTMREVAGLAVENWLDVELPKVQNQRVDLLGETAAAPSGGRGLIHVELQSANDAVMALRMAEYCLSIYRLFGQFPRQMLLYVGEAPLRMETELRTGSIVPLPGDRHSQSGWRAAAGKPGSRG